MGENGLAVRTVSIAVIQAEAFVLHDGVGNEKEYERQGGTIRTVWQLRPLVTSIDGLLGSCQIIEKAVAAALNLAAGFGSCGIPHVAISVGKGS